MYVYPGYKGHYNLILSIFRYDRDLIGCESSGPRTLHEGLTRIGEFTHTFNLKACAGLTVKLIVKFKRNKMKFGKLCKYMPL